MTTSETSVEMSMTTLTGQTQRVKIGNAISDSLPLISGVPQGGILSPLIF